MVACVWRCLLNEPDSRPEFAAAHVNGNRTACARVVTVLYKTHLNFPDVARHHAGEDDRVHARRRPVVHVVQSGRLGHQSAATHGGAAEHDAHSLRRPISALHVAHARHRHRGMERRTALQKEPRGGGDELKRRDNLVAMIVRNAHEPAEEKIVILESQGFRRRAR